MKKLYISTFTENVHNDPFCSSMQFLSNKRFFELSEFLGAGYHSVQAKSVSIFTRSAIVKILFATRSRKSERLTRAWGGFA